MTTATVSDVSRLLSNGAARRIDPAAAERAKKLAGEFESVFLSQMLNQMKSSERDGGFDGGHAEEQWTGLMNEQMGRMIAARGGVGLSDQIARELLRTQESRADALGAAGRRGTPADVGGAR